ncbi:hypothetical protein ACH42_08160 [Endozoicomonas sp. (ex Bugula neritina AB1)]|nr:hypothetical protein ACH42_08160 [Endozoicomonas sp. (ex Bugula neritina AB1)]
MNRVGDSNVVTLMHGDSFREIAHVVPRARVEAADSSIIGVSHQTPESIPLTKREIRSLKDKESSAKFRALQKSYKESIPSSMKLLDALIKECGIPDIQIHTEGDYSEPPLEYSYIDVDLEFINSRFPEKEKKTLECYVINGNRESFFNSISTEHKRELRRLKNKSSAKKSRDTKKRNIELRYKLVNDNLLKMVGCLNERAAWDYFFICFSNSVRDNLDLKQTVTTFVKGFLKENKRFSSYPLDKDVLDFSSRALQSMSEESSESIERDQTVGSEVCLDVSGIQIDETDRESEQNTSYSRCESSTARRVEMKQEDDSSLVSMIRPVKGYYFQDGLPYIIDGLSQKVRNRYISPELKKELSSKQSGWNVGCFELVSDDIKPDKLASVMKEAIKNTFQDGIIGAASTSEYSFQNSFFCSKGGEQKVIKYNGLLPSEGIIALYNPADIRQRVEFSQPSSLKESVNPGSGVLFKAEKDDSGIKWIKLANYKIKKTNKSIETNPLLRESGPLVMRGGSIEDLNENDGELFISEAMLSNLASEIQSDKSIVCTTKTLKKKLSNLKNDDVDSLNVIIQDSNHSTFSRIIKKDQALIVYVHETLGPDNEISNLIRQSLLKQLKGIDKEREIYFMTPKETLQKDFSSCGVFALKALKAFRKSNDLDTWLINYTKDKQNVRVQFSPKGDTLDLSESSKVKIGEMPSMLLKNAQVDQDAFSQKQLDTIVSNKKKLTLKSYFDKYKSSNSPYVEEERKNNHSTTCKRYKYFAAQSKSKEIKIEEKRIKDRLSPVKFTASKDVANQLLQKEFPGSPLVSDEDWENVLNLEEIVVNRKLTKLAAIIEWLDDIRVSRDHANPHSVLMNMWLEVVFNASDFSKASSKIEDMLEALAELKANFQQEEDHNYSAVQKTEEEPPAKRRKK